MKPINLDPKRAEVKWIEGYEDEAHGEAWLMLGLDVCRDFKGDGAKIFNYYLGVTIRLI